MLKSLPKSVAVIAIATVPFLATAARAQDSDDLSGFYAGVSAGYGWSKDDVKTTTTYDPAGYFASTSVDAVNASGAQQVKPRGFSAGAQIGYDINSGKFLLGAVADISSLGNARTSTVTAGYPGFAPATYTITQSVDPKWMATARAKIGIGFGQGSNVYATGGWAGEKARYDAQFTDTFGNANEVATSSKFRSGWVVGGGASIRMGRNWSLNPEYLHAEFGTETIPGGTLTANTPAVSFPQNDFTHTMKLRTDLARVAINYHF
ncbi:MAG: outer membrane protein [Novosphingobium sp.]